MVITFTGMYIMNYVPFLALKDLPKLIITRIKTYFLNNYNNNLYTTIINTYILNITNSLNNLTTILDQIITNDLIITPYDLDYLTKITSNTLKKPTGLLLTGILRPENTYSFDSYINLSTLEFVIYKIMVESMDVTNNFDFSALTGQTNSLQNELNIIINNSANTFMLPYDNIPSYQIYSDNGHNIIESDDMPYISNIISSIWFNIWTNFIKNYNDLYSNKILSYNYFYNNLGLEMTNIYNQISDVLQFNLATFTNYYEFDISLMQSIINLITVEINTFNNMYTNYVRGQTLLNVKTIDLPNDIYYFETFDTIYTKINNVISDPSSNIFSTWLTENYNYATTIINTTQYILSQGVIGTKDVLNDISMFYENIINLIDICGNNIIIPNYPNITNWINNLNNSLDNSLIPLIGNLSPTKLYSNIISITANYNNFNLSYNIYNYLFDYIFSLEDPLNLYQYVKNDTYNNLLNYFNQYLLSINKSINIIYGSLNNNNVNVLLNYLPIGGSDGLFMNIYNIVTSNDKSFAWTKYIGYNLIKSCSISLNDTIVDEHTGEYLYIRNKLDNNLNKDNGLNKMIGNTPDLFLYNEIKKIGRKLYIPLQFWFCRNIGQSLPLIALNYTDINLRLKTNSLENVSYKNKYCIFKRNVKLKCSIIATYIYVEENDRQLIAESKHEQLIEIIQISQKNYNYADIISNNNFEQAFSGRIDHEIFFQNVCKELFWSVQPLYYIDGTLKNICDSISYNNYILEQKEPYMYESFNGSIIMELNGIYISQTNSLDKIILNHTKPIYNGIHQIKPNFNDSSFSSFFGSTYDGSNNLIFNNIIVKTNGLIYNLVETNIIKLKNIMFGPIDTIIIKMNGNNRESEKTKEFYNFVEPWNRHKTSIDKGIYLYSFALEPGDSIQPTGGINLSKINKIGIDMLLNENLINIMKTKDVSISVTVYNISLNILRIMSGLCGLAFKS